MRGPDDQDGSRAARCEAAVAVDKCTMMRSTCRTRSIRRPRTARTAFRSGRHRRRRGRDAAQVSAGGGSGDRRRSRYRRARTRRTATIRLRRRRHALAPFGVCSGRLRGREFASIIRGERVGRRQRALARRIRPLIGRRPKRGRGFGGAVAQSSALCRTWRCKASATTSRAARPLQLIVQSEIGGFVHRLPRASAERSGGDATRAIGACVNRSRSARLRGDADAGHHPSRDAVLRHLRDVLRRVSAALPCFAAAGRWRDVVCCHATHARDGRAIGASAPGSKSSGSWCAAA